MGKNRKKGRMSGIYIHIPFCERKCIYCDFYSVENLEQINMFLNSVLNEIEIFKSEADFLNEVCFETIYFGGGTPSLLEVYQIEKILNAFYKSFKIADKVEITVEANPGTVDKNKLSGFRSIGINRLSFGVQSFFNDDLEFLGRIHTSKDAIESIISAFDSGFENVNVDLIFGLPQQSKEKWIKNLLKAVELNVPHISAYNLIVEKGTPLNEMVRRGKVKLLSGDEEAELYEITMETLEGFNYIHYEVSNYARWGFECRHNLKYWEYENYIGFGPSAHSFWENKRWWNVANLKKYISAIENGKLPIANFEILSEEKMIEEFIYLGLRSTGVDLKKFKEKFGFDFIDDEINENLNELKKLGYVDIDEFKVRLTRKGFLVCDEITVNLISKIKYVLR
ncbi:MAG: radical SAM family heme chaperone HemW [Candidatus Kryptonium sp.]